MRYLIILVLFLINNYAFTQEYIPLVKEGKYWIYNHYSHSSCFLMGWNSSELRYFIGDTIINSQSYKKLISSLAPSQLPPYNITSSKTLCYMREDTLLRKVFMVNFDENVFPCVDSSSEILIWDFGMKAGDSLPDCLYKIFYPIGNDPNFYLVLDSIVGNYFFTFGYPPGICGDLAQFAVSFVEGFGMEDGPIYKRYGTFLADYCEGTLEQCNIISSVKDTHEKVSNKLEIYPNPASNFIHVETHFDISNVDFIDQNGKVVMKSRDLDNYIGDLRSGIYIVRCLTKKNEMIYTKFVKI